MMTTTGKLIFLKLGGSLITDKSRSSTPRRGVIERLAGEIAYAWKAVPDLQLVLGHGSGSFGHVAADKYGTRMGVNSPAAWIGFAEVWRQARVLNQIVIESLVIAGLPVLAFPPSACVTSEDGKIVKWDTSPLEACLKHHLLPVVNGDVVFDDKRGGTIVSTEEVFAHLAHLLKPGHILMAGIERGVWTDFPERTHFIDTIDGTTLYSISASLKGSVSTDVTGGMIQKVQEMVSLARSIPNLEIQIFSGEQPGNLQEVLLGSKKGTLVTAG